MHSRTTLLILNFFLCLLFVFFKIMTQIKGKKQTKESMFCTSRYIASEDKKKSKTKMFSILFNVLLVCVFFFVHIC